MKHLILAMLLVIEGSAGAVEWSIRSYACPSDALFQGFVMEGTGRIYLPDPPSEEASSIQSFIQRSSLVFREYLRDLPEGSLVVLDRDRHTLAARTTAEGHLALETLLGEWNQQSPKMITLQITVLEVPLSKLATLLDETAAQQDHTAHLKRLEEAGAQMIACTKIEAKSGLRSNIRTTSMLNHITEFAARADGSSEACNTKQVPIGLSVEVDPILGYDGRIIDMNLSISHTSKAAVRSIPLGTLAGKRIHGSVQDFVTEQWTTAISLAAGQSRLLGAVPAEDPLNARLCFVTAHAPIVIGVNDERAETWLKTHGHAVVPIPTGKKESAPKLGITSGMVVKKFRVPPDFLSVTGTSLAPAGDAFAPSSPEPTFSVRTTAESVLKEQGIAFPEGASATLNRATSVLTVVNLPTNIVLVESFVQSISYHAPAVLQIRAHIIEADSSLIRKIAYSSLSVTDHREAWSALQAELAAGRGRIVGVAAIETKSGQRCQAQSGPMYAWATAKLTPQISETKAENAVTAGTALPSAELTATIERMPLGLQVEIEPILGSDGFTIDLDASIKRQCHPPTEHFANAETQPGNQTVDTPTVDFHPQELNTSLTTSDKLWRMIGTWQAMGADGKLDPAVMQAVFIQAVVLRVGE